MAGGEASGGGLRLRRTGPSFRAGDCGPRRVSTAHARILLAGASAPLTRDAQARVVGVGDPQDPGRVNVAMEGPGSRGFESHPLSL